MFLNTLYVYVNELYMNTVKLDVSYILQDV